MVIVVDKDLKILELENKVKMLESAISAMFLKSSIFKVDMKNIYETNLFYKIQDKNK